MIKYVVGEMRVIANAPAAFLAALLVLSGAMWWAISWRYSGVIENKDGIIALYKERLNGASPDQAKAKIEGLETQVSMLRNREWPPLTPTMSAALKEALRDVPQNQIDVFAQDRDGIFLVRGLVSSFNEMAWTAKRNTSMNPLPDGITVWPRSEVGQKVRDALAKVTGLPVRSLFAIHNYRDRPQYVERRFPHQSL